MTAQTLYLQRQSLEGPLTLGSLRKQAHSGIAWFSLEPRPFLPAREGRILTGRIPGLAPLADHLLEGFDDLPLLAASLYSQRQWSHLHDVQPLSQTSASLVTWSLDPLEDAQEIPDLIVKQQRVLTWQDRKRFGFEDGSSLPKHLQVEHYFQAGRRLTWRIRPANGSETNT